MSIEDMMNALNDGNPGTFKMMFDQEMINRTNDRINHFKDFVSQNFTNPEAEYNGYSEEDLDQVEPDTEDGDIQDFGEDDNE
jgi:hypothetical protein